MPSGPPPAFSVVRSAAVAKPPETTLDIEPSSLRPMTMIVPPPSTVARIAPDILVPPSSRMVEVYSASPLIEPFPVSSAPSVLPASL